MAKIDFIIKHFNNIPEYESQRFVERVFNNDIERFFMYIQSKDKFDELDTDVIEENYYKQYLNFLYNTDYPKFAGEVIRQTDVMDGPNGYYIEIGDRSDLIPLFCDNSRDTSEQDVAKMIFDEDHQDWMGWYDGVDIYHNVIDDLTPENISYLKSKILEEFKDEQIDPTTDLLETIAEEQGHEDYVSITPEILDRIFSDEKSIKEILNDNDIESNLVQIWNYASESAYQEEISNLVYEGLKEYFDSWSWETKKTSSGKDMEIFKIIISDMDSVILELIDSYGYFYAEDYISILSQLISDGERDCIGFRIPDYADWTLQRNHMNEIFKDYV
jgi:hypothetical protein